MFDNVNDNQVGHSERNCSGRIAGFAKDCTVLRVASKQSCVLWKRIIPSYNFNRVPNGTKVHRAK